MSKTLDFLHLIALQYIPMAIFSLLVGATATISALPDFRFWIAAISLFCVVGGFNAFNAIADKEIDKINKPSRPVPSKKISEKEALWFTITLYFFSLLAAFTINLYFFVIIFFCVILTTMYSLPGINLKKYYFIGTLTVTIFYAVLCTLSGWALYPNNAIPWSIIFFLFFMGFSLAISKDFMDVVGDSYHNIKTFPVKIGYSQSVALVFIALTFSFVFLIFLILQNILPIKYYLLLIVFPLFLFNINGLRKKQQAHTYNYLFNKTVILIILLELIITGLAIT